jgi:hypothetical protein
MAGNNNKVTHDMTTGVGVLSFPKVFQSTADKDEKTGEPVYNIQILIPKSQRDDVKAIMAGIKKVAEAKWGANWKEVRLPLRDGDKEKNQLTEDGTPKGEKYPERLGHYFLNARSKRPIIVVDKTLTPITDPNELYGGVIGKISISLYPYSQQGNHGVGVGLNGVQKIRDGEAFGGGRPSVESMFDMLDDEDDTDLDLDEDGFEEEEEVEETPAPKKQAAKKAPAKKAAAKKKAEPVEEDDLDIEDGEDDLYDDLDED